MYVYKAVKIFDCLFMFRFLKDEIVHRAIESKLGLTEKDFLWIITVPAIWTDGAKHFMREAAEEVNIKET